MQLISAVATTFVAFLLVATVAANLFDCSDSQCTQCQESQVQPYTCVSDSQQGTSSLYTCPTDGSDSMFVVYSSPDCSGTPVSSLDLGQPGTCTYVDSGEYVMVQCGGNGPSPPQPQEQKAVIKSCTDQNCGSCTSQTIDAGACYSANSGNSVVITCGPNIDYTVYSTDDCSGAPFAQLNLGKSGSCNPLGSSGSISVVCLGAATHVVIAAIFWMLLAAAM